MQGKSVKLKSFQRKQNYLKKLSFFFQSLFRSNELFKFKRTPNLFTFNFHSVLFWRKQVKSVSAFVVLVACRRKEVVYQVPTQFPGSFFLLAYLPRFQECSDSRMKITLPQGNSFGLFHFSKTLKLSFLQCAQLCGEVVGKKFQRQPTKFDQYRKLYCFL